MNDVGVSFADGFKYNFNVNVGATKGRPYINIENIFNSVSEADTTIIHHSLFIIHLFKSIGGADTLIFHSSSFIIHLFKSVRPRRTPQLFTIHSSLFTKNKTPPTEVSGAFFIQLVITKDLTVSV